MKKIDLNWHNDEQLEEMCNTIRDNPELRKVNEDFLELLTQETKRKNARILSLAIWVIENYPAEDLQKLSDVVRKTDKEFADAIQVILNSKK